MEDRPTAILLKFPGTNCDVETERALKTVGFSTRTLQFALVNKQELENAQLIVLPGGFSYGDYIMAGRLAQLELQQRLGDALHLARERGKYLLGICNGFQILMRLGLLPQGSLIANTSERFICCWVGLQNHRPDNVFLSQLPNNFELPIAHAEGRFVTSEENLSDIAFQESIALTYAQNINGSHKSIAGLQDESGHVFGLMPHPERFLLRQHHYDPDWPIAGEWGWGYYFFKAIYDHISGA